MPQVSERPAPLGLTAEKAANLTPRAQASYLLDELCKKRLLIPADAGKSAYVAPHRSVLEFLTGCALAPFYRAALAVAGRTCWRRLDICGQEGPGIQIGKSRSCSWRVASATQDRYWNYLAMPNGMTFFVTDWLLALTA